MVTHSDKGYLLSCQPAKWGLMCQMSKGIIFLSGGQKRSQLKQGIRLVLRSRCAFDVISFRVDEITSGDITFHALLHRTLRWREIPDFTPVFLTN